MLITSCSGPCGLELCILVHLSLSSTGHPCMQCHLQASVLAPEMKPGSAHQLTPAGTSMGPAEPRPGSRNNHHTEDPAAFGAAFPAWSSELSFGLFRVEKVWERERCSSDQFHAAVSKFCFPTSEYNKWLLSYLTWS